MKTEMFLVEFLREAPPWGAEMKFWLPILHVCFLLLHAACVSRTAQSEVVGRITFSAHIPGEGFIASAMGNSVNPLYDQKDEITFRLDSEGNL
ncbi:MAG: hypothetical protein JJU29_09195 [Verrucomicrobia bacterium]|nr:hypothetical protein [Verrucomicrobiota bacterium]MCH8513154.1 hypothetical protein [Kiritimatiellia bacterium]